MAWMLAVHGIWGHGDIVCKTDAACQGCPGNTTTANASTWSWRQVRVQKASLNGSWVVGLLLLTAHLLVRRALRKLLQQPGPLSSRLVSLGLQSLAPGLPRCCLCLKSP